jgi:uncharacterized protein (DUF362 family)
VSAALGRRRFLAAGIAASLAPAAAACSRGGSWERGAYRKRERSRVAILEARSYERPLVDVLLAGIRLFGLAVQGKTVVLKPNFVEFDAGGVINTHPAVIGAAVEAFRRLGARAVLVAEGPGHRRDTEYLVTASGLFTVLRETGAAYVDLNHDDTSRALLRSDFTPLRSLHLPNTVLGADLLVSMPKLKTHHWAGVTLSMKNMFGIVPGAIYGWPKNVLHWAGIDESIVDINAALPMPQFAIVDGIVGMEGNGPIQGTPRPSGLLVLGDDVVAVDVTCARLMTIDPMKVKYLAMAGRFLGNVLPERIEQVGEGLDRLRQDFGVLDRFKHLKTVST